VREIVPSLRDLLYFPTPPGTDVPGYHMPPFRGFSLLISSHYSNQKFSSRTLSKLRANLGCFTGAEAPIFHVATGRREFFSDP
jgi:hypothetical protein